VGIAGSSATAIRDVPYHRVRVVLSSPPKRGGSVGDHARKRITQWALCGGRTGRSSCICYSCVGLVRNEAAPVAGIRGSVLLRTRRNVCMDQSVSLDPAHPLGLVLEYQPHRECRVWGRPSVCHEV
jgi:hypothetical protein